MSRTVSDPASVSSPPPPPARARSSSTRSSFQMARSRGYSVVGRKLTTISCKIKLLVALAVVLVVMLATFLTIYFTLLHDFGTAESEDNSYYLNEAAVTSDGKTWHPDCEANRKRGGPPSRKFSQAFNSGEGYFDCYPDSASSAAGEVSETKCRARGCCWNGDPGKSPVKCYYPRNYGYELDGDIVSVFDGFEVPLKRLPMPSRYGDDIQQVRLKVEPQTAHRLHVLFYDPQESRYQVPDPKIQVSEPPNEEQVPLYSLNYNTNSSPFNLNVRRTDTETIIFDTSIGGFTFSSQFLQLSSRLPSKRVFGLSDHDLEGFGIDLNWKTWLLFSRQSRMTNYGSHPFYICLENDGKAHGVLLLNSNALEVQLQPMPAVTYRAIGGLLDFYFFLGPTPQDVIRQYADAVGLPLMPPYWSFGLHLSFSDDLSLQDVESVLNDMEASNVTGVRDVVHVNIHHNEAPFVYGQTKTKSLQLSVASLKSGTRRVVAKVTPSVNRHTVPFELGLNHGVFVNDSWRINPVLGMNGEELAAYPDFGNHATLTWWTDRLNELKFNVDFDGLHLDDNVPTTHLDKGSVDGCLPDNFNKPPFLSKLFESAIYNNTVCMDSVQSCGSKVCNHYDVHNLYGHLMAKTTNDAVREISPEKRILVITSSSFAGTGRYAGRSQTQPKVTWTNLKTVLTSTLTYGVFGIPFSGTTLILDPKDDELNLRAIQLATFLPYFHIQDLNLTETEADNPEFMESFQVLLQLRYELLPHIYSLFHKSHELGMIPLQPVWFEFPKDERSLNASSQFMWGPSLMVTPVLEQGEKLTQLYLPESDWFDYYTGERYPKGDLELEAYLYSTIKPVYLHVKAGHIISKQIPGNDLDSSKKNPMTLLVALDGNFSASGYLFWDDGDCLDSYEIQEFVEVDFEASPGLLTIRGKPAKLFFRSTFNNAFIERVKIYGLSAKPGTIIIDGNYHMMSKQIEWSNEYKVLLLHQILIPISRETKVEWSF